MTVRSMREEDHDAVAALFEEMQAHYRVPCPPRDEILDGLARMPTGCFILVAGKPRPKGFAALTPTFPGPGLKPGLFLKELFVSATGRGQGLGRSLLRACAAHALREGFARVDWTADRTNPRLMRLYQSTGALAQEEKVFFRLTGPALAAFPLGEA